MLKIEKPEIVTDEMHADGKYGRFIVSPLP